MLASEAAVPAAGRYDRPALMERVMDAQRAYDIHEAGDHLVVIGAVADAGFLHDGTPLTTMAGLCYPRTPPEQ